MQQVSGRCTFSQNLSVAAACSSGLGIAVLPRWMIQAELSGGTLIELLRPYDVTTTDFDQAVWGVTASRTRVPLKVRAFLTYLRRAYAAAKLNGSAQARRPAS